MPTARPIIVASIGVLEPMSVNAVIAVTPVMPRPTPKIAVMIGMPAAIAEPNVSSSTTSAMPMPISSDAPPGGDMRLHAGAVGLDDEPVGSLPEWSANRSSAASIVAGSMSAGESTSHWKEGCRSGRPRRAG